MLRSPNTQPIVTLPSPTITSASPIGQAAMEHIVVTVPSTSKPKTRSSKKHVPNTKNLTVNSYNMINPSADFKLPAEIFASDDSISDAGAGGSDDLNNFNELNENETVMSTSKDKMLGGVNIKVERVTEPAPSSKEKKAKNSKDNANNFNLADIKTELQDDFDWNNMTLATVHNSPNLNKLQTMLVFFIIFYDSSLSTMVV